MPAGANRPLAGITVLDFGQVYQGPYATLLMAKAGADVIKIEPPQGEPLRRRAPPGKSTTFPIAMLNSNKRAITLNLRHERGRALLFRMVERGDVLLENFAPGVMDRLGVGWRCCTEQTRVSSTLRARGTASQGQKQSDALDKATDL
jgi:crotonobetainyl-CoA:carnitine CoA-transferase CaiB-like acyl-CoA transferase